MEKLALFGLQPFVRTFTSRRNGTTSLNEKRSSVWLISTGTATLAMVLHVDAFVGLSHIFRAPSSTVAKTGGISESRRTRETVCPASVFAE